MAAFDLHDTWPLQVVSTGVPFLYVPVRSRRATPTRPPSARYSPTAPRHRSWCSVGRRSSRRRRSTRACSRRTRWASPKTPRVVRRPAPWAPPSPTMVVFPWWPRHASSSSRDWRWGGRVRSTSWSAGGMRTSWARGSGAGRDRGRGTPRLGPVGGALTSAACSSHHEPVCRHTSRGAGTCLMEARVSAVSRLDVQDRRRAAHGVRAATIASSTAQVTGLWRRAGAGISRSGATASTVSPARTACESVAR